MIIEKVQYYELSLAPYGKVFHSRLSVGWSQGNCFAFSLSPSLLPAIKLGRRPNGIHRNELSIREGCGEGGSGPADKEVRHYCPPRPRPLARRHKRDQPPRRRHISHPQKLQSF